MGVLKIKNWAEFQHYKDRNPPWIKLQTNTFKNYDFSRLPDASKLLAVCIWTLAADSKDGSIPADFEYIKRQCNLSDFVKIEHLKELIIKGYVIDASNALTDHKQTACPERETEEEKKEKKRTYVLKEKPNQENFQRFWDLFPRQRRGSKEKAYPAYISALTRATEEQIFKGLDAYCQSREVSEGYAKGAAAWLNDDRWASDYSNQPGGGIPKAQDKLTDAQKAKNLKTRRDKFGQILDNVQEKWLELYEFQHGKVVL